MGTSILPDLFAVLQPTYQHDALPSPRKLGSRYTIEDVRHKANSRGGSCLSDRYDPIKKLEFECRQGHRWMATWYSIRDGSWCGVCYQTKRKTKSIETALLRSRLAAIARGGKCLSTQFAPSGRHHLQFECDKGHRWTTAWQQVVLGTWCPFCVGLGRLTIDDARSAAALRGGECLSAVVVNCKVPLEWRCALAHTWMANLDAIRNGKSWCPICSSGQGERLCRAVLERIFKLPFKRTRPTWLRNTNGYRLELDGYNQDLKLAFEYQGTHHYEDRPGFSSGGGLAGLSQRDGMKRQICWGLKVDLIIIPEFINPYDVVRCANEVEIAIIRAGRKVPKWERPDSLPELYLPFEHIFGNETTSAMRAFAIAKGGALLSSRAVGSRDKLEWECSIGHRWMATWSHVSSGTWCPKCGGSLKLSLGDAQTVAAQRGGVCLTELYINAREKMLWRCRFGHEWEATLGDIRSGRWCQKCSAKATDNLGKWRSAKSSTDG